MLDELELTLHLVLEIYEVIHADNDFAGLITFVEDFVREEEGKGAHDSVEALHVH